MVFGVILIAIGLTVTVCGILAISAYHRVIATGVRVRAKVVGNQIVSSSKGTHGYALMVMFTYRNTALGQEQRLIKRYASSAYLSKNSLRKQIGKEIDVIYSEQHSGFVTSADGKVNVRNYLQLIFLITFFGVLPIALGILAI